MELVDEICDLLHSHGNRDKIVALTSYTFKLWGASSKRQNLLTASAQLASARAALRLFDDAALLKVFFKYRLGKQDGPWWGSLGVTNNLFTIAYLQAEKLVFLLDTGVLKLDDTKAFRIRTAHKLFWSLYSFIALIRSIRALHITAQNLKDPNRTKCASARFTQASLTSTKLLLDVIHSVSWLPRGWLWGSSLQTSQAAGVATLSGILSLVIHYNGKRLMS